jgi:dihydrofolate synthase/folylpolyglutamate synthase
MTQQELLARLQQCKTWKTDLIPMRRLAALLGNPQEKLRFVHVAGTNGKGSTCAMIASVLESGGYRTGRFVSPYILNFRERIQCNGTMIPEDDLCRIGQQVLSAADRLAEDQLFPTEFDVVTMIGFLWFLEQQCDVVVLEVGLGGGIDSTNIITPSCTLVSAITSISLDHTAILGTTEREIASEKAGIIKEKGVTVLGASIQGDALHVIREMALSKTNVLLIPEYNGITLQKSEVNGIAFSYRHREFFLPMAGLYQLENAAVALTVIDVLEEEGFDLPIDVVINGFAKAAFPARMELLGTEPLLWLDGAHNPQGVAALCETLDVVGKGKKIVCLCGMMTDKSCEEAVQILSSHVAQVVTVTVDSPRAMAAEDLAKLWQQKGVPAEAAASPEAAVEKAIALAGSDGAVICCGSLYLCAELRPLLIDKTK